MKFNYEISRRSTVGPRRLVIVWVVGSEGDIFPKRQVAVVSLVQTRSLGMVDTLNSVSVWRDTLQKPTLPLLQTHLCRVCGGGDLHLH